MDEFDKKKYACKLFQAWPIAMGQMSLAYGERNSFHVLPITFHYRKWLNIRVNSRTPTAIDPAAGVPSKFEEEYYE